MVFGASALPVAGPDSFLERMPPKEIGEIMPGARQVLLPAAMQTQVVELLQHFVVLVRGEASPQRRVMRDRRSRMVLGHERYVDIRRELFSDKSEHCLAVVDLPRKNQVTDDQAGFGQSVLVERQLTALLAKHLRYSRRGRRRVIPDIGVLMGERVVHVFQVGQIDIDDTRQRLDRPPPVVAVGIENVCGSPATSLKGIHDRPHLQNRVRRRHKPDPGSAGVENRLNLTDDLLKLHVIDGGRFSVGADVVVLAVDALEVAVGEEYIAYPVRSREDRFLPPVGADRSDGETVWGFAVAEPAGRSVGPAIAGTGRAAPQGA